VRIVISSAPKSGNRWLKCLLRQIYGLEVLHGKDKPPTQPGAFRSWAARGFPDGTIYHQHCRFSPTLCDAIEAVPAHLVTIVRDPYDVFVSHYYWVQEQAAHHAERDDSRPKERLVGKPLTHPDAFAFLAEEFAGNLLRAEGWLTSGRAIVVRYEGLRDNPVAELTAATDAIAPVPAETIAAAVEACRAENMRQMGRQKAWQVSDAQFGAAREGLNAAHLAIFREQYADRVRSLGYTIR